MNKAAAIAIALTLLPFLSSQVESQSNSKPVALTATWAQALALVVSELPNAKHRFEPYMYLLYEENGLIFVRITFTDGHTTCKGGRVYKVTPDGKKIVDAFNTK